MKKVLIISYLFAPDNQVGAIRPTKFAKYLSNLGFEVDIVTAAYEGPSDINILKDIENVHRIYRLGVEESQKSFVIDHQVCNVKSMQLAVENNKPLTKNKIFDNVIVKNLKYTYRQYLSRKKDKVFLKNFKKLMQFETFFENKYDIVFSTYGPAASIQCGLEAKKCIENVIWICDFRDPMVTEDMSFLYKPYNWYMQNIACSKADFITTVSSGYKKRICKDRFDSKTHVIPNGYDNDDIMKGENLELDKKFSITYVGALYEGKRDISTLFKALSELIENGKIIKSDLVFKYAGNDFMFLFRQAQKYNMQDILINFGRLSRNKCLELQFSSRYLVLSTWNNEGEEGVFPGKFLEYMLINKPIISIIEGNLQNSEVASVMNEANLGVSFEAANEKRDYNILKEYIKNEYIRYKSGLEPDFNPNKEVVERYDYNNIIKQFLELIQ